MHVDASRVRRRRGEPQEKPLPLRGAGTPEQPSTLALDPLFSPSITPISSNSLDPEYKAKSTRSGSFRISSPSGAQFLGVFFEGISAPPKWPVERGHTRKQEKRHDSLTVFHGGQKTIRVIEKLFQHLPSLVVMLRPDKVLGGLQGQQEESHPFLDSWASRAHYSHAACDRSRRASYSMFCHKVESRR